MSELDFYKCPISGLNKLNRIIELYHYHKNSINLVDFKTASSGIIDAFNILDLEYNELEKRRIEDLKNGY